VESSSLLGYAEDAIRSRKRERKKKERGREREREREKESPVYFPSDSLHFMGFTKPFSRTPITARENHKALEDLDGTLCKVS